MDLHLSNTNMIQHQIRTWDVSDVRILDLYLKHNRSYFVPEEFKSLAYNDMRIPLDENQTMLSPKEEARILQELKIKPTDEVLEVGTGSGFVTILLAELAKSVLSIDIFPKLIKIASRNIREARTNNVTIEEHNAFCELLDEGPFDVIIITGAMHELPEFYKENLNIGGRLFAYIGESPAIKGIVIERITYNTWKTRTVYETDIQYLLNKNAKDNFIL